MLYNTTTKSKIFDYRHIAPVISVLLTDQYLISSSFDKSVKIWSLKDRSEVAKLVHDNRCTNFDISPSGKMLAVGGEGFVTFWKVENFTKAGFISFSGFVSDIRYNSKGDKIITGNNQGAVHLLEVHPY